MSFEIIALLVLIFSFCGMFFLISRKIPAIVKLPNNLNSVPGKDFKNKFTKKTKDAILKKRFGTQLLVQKTLSKTRIIILKLDNKIFVLNQKIKKNTERTKENIDFEKEEVVKKIKEKK